MARRRSGGGGGFFMKIIWALFILSMIFAWFKTPVPAGTEGVASFAQAKSKSVEAWVNEITANGFDFSSLFKGSDGLVIELDGENKELGGEPKVDQKESNKELEGLKIAPEQSVNYNRDEWKHWSSSGSSCWDTREEVLYAEATPGSIKLLDKEKKETKLKGSACSIAGGEWKDPYSGKTFTDPSKLDVDHMIPLSYTAKHGGQEWNAKKKEEYANYTKFSGHLIAVDAGQNRSKSDKGPSQWKPANTAYHCTYALDWITISKKWDLSTTAADKAALQQMLGTC